MQDKPSRFGKYSIKQLLGSGSYGSVYLAYDNSLNRDVAIKVLHPHLLFEETFIEKFRREAAITASLNHPNIMPVYEVDQFQGRMYICMPYIKGITLGDYIKQETRLSWQNTLDLFITICDAIGYAHSRGIVHADIKPSNVIIQENNQPIVLDFGFAHSVSENQSAYSKNSAVAGTPNYIAPEIWDGNDPSPSSDIYSLGCILFEMITGQVLFDGKTPFQIMRAHEQGAKLPKRWPEDVPDALSDMISIALAKDITDRYTKVGLLIDSIMYLNDTPSPEMISDENAIVIPSPDTANANIISPQRWQEITDSLSDLGTTYIEVTIERIDTNTPRLWQIHSIHITIKYTFSDQFRNIKFSITEREILLKIADRLKLTIDNERVLRKFFQELVISLVDSATRRIVWDWEEVVAAQPQYHIASPSQNNPVTISRNRTVLAQKIANSLQEPLRKWGIVIDAIDIEGMEIDPELIKRLTRNKDQELAEAEHQARIEAMQKRILATSEAEDQSLKIARILDVLTSSSQTPLTETTLANVIRAVLKPESDNLEH